MRKLLGFMLIMILCLGVVGCNKTDTDKKKENKEEKEITMSDFSWGGLCCRYR